MSESDQDALRDIHERQIDVEAAVGELAADVERVRDRNIALYERHVRMEEMLANVMASAQRLRAELDQVRAAAVDAIREVRDELRDEREEGDWWRRGDSPPL